MNRLLAVAINPPMGTDRNLNETYPNIGSLVIVLLQNAYTLIGLILLVLLIFGGLMFIIGAGSDDQKKAAQGKAVITDALIGFAVVFLAYFIIQIVEVVTGLRILNPSLAL